MKLGSVLAGMVSLLRMLYLESWVRFARRSMSSKLLSRCSIQIAHDIGNTVLVTILLSIVGKPLLRKVEGKHNGGLSGPCTCCFRPQAEICNSTPVCIEAFVDLAEQTILLLMIAERHKSRIVSVALLSTGAGSVEQVHTISACCPSYTGRWSRGPDGQQP